MSAAMMEWRRLAAVTMPSGRKSANSDLRVCWDSIWDRCFEPRLESLVTQSGSVEGRRDALVSLRALVAQTCEWLDSQAQAKVVPDGDPDPIRAKVEFARDFARVGEALTKAEAEGATEGQCFDAVPEALAALSNMLKPAATVSSTAHARVKSWLEDSRALAARIWPGMVEAVTQQRLPSPQGDTFVDVEGAPETLPDLRAQTGRVVDVCHACGQEGVATRLQFEGRLHEAMCAAIEVSRCTVDNGNLTRAFLEAAKRSRCAGEPHQEMSRLHSGLKSARGGPMGFDKGLVGHLKNLDDEVEGAREVHANAEHLIMAGLEADESVSSVVGAEAKVLRALKSAQEVRATVSAKFVDGLKIFEEEAMPIFVPAFEAELSKNVPDRTIMRSWSEDPRVQLLPSLVQRYGAFVEAAEKIGVDDAHIVSARAAHKRMRVFVAVLHVTAQLFGEPSQKSEPDRPATVKQLRRLHLWDDLPAFLRAKLEVPEGAAA